MSLVNLRTNFKDLKYGHDREGGGSSNQPYIKTPINVNLPPAFNFLGSDFILRGGPIGAPLATVNDVVRLTRYFADTKTPSGLLFIAKQNLLSRTAVRTQASGKLVNEGVYTPLSTLAQAGVSAFGLHLNKQGLNPIPGGLGSLRTYSGITQQISNLVIEDNRLVTLYNSKIQPRYILPNLLTYQGGPGSILGVGVTNIKFADQRTGINNPEVFNSGFFKTEEQGYYDFAVFRRIAPTYQASRILNLNGLSAIYSKIVFDDYNTIYSLYNADGDQDNLLTFNPDVYTPDDNGNPTFDVNDEKLASGIITRNVQGDLIDINNVKYQPLGASRLYQDGTLADKIETQYSPSSLNSSGSNEYWANRNEEFTPQNDSAIQNPIGASTIYKNLIPNSSPNLETNKLFLKASPFSGSSYYQYASGLGPQNVYSLTDNKFGTATTNESIGGAYVFTQNELINEEPYQNNIITKLKDFRATIRNRIKEDTIAEGAASIILSNSPDYSKYNIENRINLGDPGNKFSKNIASYTLGVNGRGNSSANSYDKMALVPLYTSENADTTIKDLVNFRIAAISNDDPTQKTYIHFRAFLGSISDSYSGKWNSSRYVGRGEDFYTYDGFSRKISLSFTIAAQSKIELIPLYEKLNYLISNMAPDYSKVGYMRGPLVTLTIGGYILEMPGFIEGMSIEIGEETSWEIGIDDAGEPDTSVKQLAHVIKVSGFSFTPIHRFAPRKANVNNLSATKYILNELPPDPPPPSPTPEPVIPDPPPLPDPKPKPKPVPPPPLQAVTTYQSDKATPPPNMGKSTSTPGSGNNITGNTAGQGPQLVLDPKTGKLVIK